MKKIWVLLWITCIVIFCEGTNYAKGRDYLIIISTDFGTINIILFDEAPLHKENFLKLCKSGFYNGTTFHRIITNFMIQGGDPYSKDSIPENDGLGGPGYTIPAEITPSLKHDFGALAAARQGDQVNPQRASSGSQFYIVQNKEGAHHLDGAYTIFGQVVKGFDTIDAIAAQPKDMRDRPLKDIRINVRLQKKSHRKLLKMLQTIKKA